MFQKIEGIVIRTTDYGETNKIVTLYTKELGKIGVMARGAKKPKSRLASLAQPFIHGHFLVQKSSGLGTLQQGEIIHSFRHVQNDLLLTAYGSIILELTDRLTEEGMQSPSLFELLYQTINYMNEGYDAEILTRIYEVKMLYVAGIAPELSCCTSCGNRESNFAFSIQEGGLLCERCRFQDTRAYPMSHGTAKLLRLFYYVEINRLGSISVKEETRAELNQIISAYYDQYSGLFLKSRKFLEQIKKLELD